MIWLYIYYAIAFVTYFVLCVIWFKIETRTEFICDIVQIAVLALLAAMIWPLVIVVAIGYGFLKLLQGKRGESFDDDYVATFDESPSRTA